MSWETPERSSRCDARMLERDDKLVCLPSHGENRGSSPLGRASKIKYFCKRRGPRPTLKPPFQGDHRWQDRQAINGVNSSRLAISRRVTRAIRAPSIFAAYSL